MPRVPQSKRQVLEQGTGNVRTNVKPPAEAFGGGSVFKSKLNDIDKLAGAGKQIKRKLDDFDKTEVKRARRELQTYANQKSQEFKMLKNRNPSLSREEFDKEWEQTYSDISMTLGNDDQRLMFGEVKADFDVTRKNQYGGHQLSEAINYQNDEDTASIAAEMQSAADKFTNPVAIAGSLQAQEIIYKDYALRNGDANEDEEGNVTLTKDGERNFNKVVSGTHLAVVQRAVSEGKDKVAQDYFNSIKSDKRLTPEVKDRMLKLTEGSTNLGQAQRLADKAMKDNLSEAAALAEARKLEGEAEVFAVREVKNRYAEKDNLTVKNEKKITRVHMDQLDETKGSYTPNQKDYLTMSPSQRRTFDSRKSNLLKGKTPKTNWQVYTDLNTMAREFPDKFAKVDMMLRRNELGDSDFRHFSNLQEKILKKDSEFVNNFFSIGKQLDASYKEAKIPYNTKIKSHKERRGKFERYVQDKVLQQQESMKRKLSDTEIQAVIDTALISGSVEDGGFLYFDKDAKLFETTADERADFNIEGHKVQDYIETQKWLRDRKKPHSQADVIKLMKELENEG